VPFWGKRLDQLRFSRVRVLPDVRARFRSADPYQIDMGRRKSTKRASDGSWKPSREAPVAAAHSR
jgi:hypothetical protein